MVAVYFFGRQYWLETNSSYKCGIDTLKLIHCALCTDLRNFIRFATTFFNTGAQYTSETEHVSWLFYERYIFSVYIYATYFYLFLVITQICILYKYSDVHSVLATCRWEVYRFLNIYSTRHMLTFESL